MRPRMSQPDRRPAFEPLEPRLLLSARLLISEFMATNTDTLLDEDNDSSDWIEIYNPTSSPVNLNNWRLRDSGNQWVFPDVTLEAGRYLLVFASDKDRRDPEGELHANFKLTGDGEYLALLDANGNVVHEYGDLELQEGYPEQRQDMSYGVLYEEHGAHELIQKGGAVRYLVPSNDSLGLSWIEPDFQDAAWQAGTTGLGFGFGGGSGTTTLVPKGSVWRYLDNGSDQGTAWREPDFNDNSWKAGPAKLGYSDGAVTVVDYGDSGDKYITTYFRYKFDVANAWQVTGLTLRLLRDDGAVVYLNGQELRRSNMPLGTIDYRTVASASVGGADESTYFQYYFEPVGLRDGQNVLAVEVHQISGGSSDLGFDLELVAETSTSELIETDVQAQMLGRNASLYLRVPFTVNDPLEYSELILSMAYEDGYVAYLNGVPVASRNAPASPQWSSSALADRPIQDAMAMESVDLSAYLPLLEAGENVLAIHALNDGASDGTFLVLPKLMARAGVTIRENYFTTPTPGAANVPGVLGVVEDTKFSVDRGFFEEHVDVQITTLTPGATIRYTLDGTEPTASHGSIYNAMQPVHIEHTTMLRAAAFRPGWISTNVDTQTYIFLDDVLGQSAAPQGLPVSWAAEPADYEMDPEVVSLYSSTLKDDLLSLPTMSIVTDQRNLFDAAIGIYANPNAEGVSWERPVSLEYFTPDGTEDFQVNAGLRMYGGVGRNPGYKKHSFRVLFKGIYGPTKLRYPLFGEEAVDEFDTIILRSNFNDAWVWGGATTQFTRDEYTRRLQIALGARCGVGNFVHLYINGLYWGLYNPTERPDQSFSASYFGGDKDQWEGINSGAATGESGTAAWNAFRGFEDNHDLTAMADYQMFMGNNPNGTNNPNYECYLDAENYIEYLLLNFYTGNRDWPGHNWYAGKLRGPESTGFKWYTWDAEWVVGMNSGVYENRTGEGGSMCEPFRELRYNPEFQMLFADVAHRAFFNGGPLYVNPSMPQWDPSHPERNRPAALYAELCALIEPAVRAESARWGDVRSGSPYTLLHWQNQRNWVLNTYMPARSAIVLDQLKAIGLYPSVVAPSFYVAGHARAGGPVSSLETLTIQAPAGTIYYTTDGSDPRKLGGAVSQTAQVYAGPISLSYSKHVKSRALYNGQWSALNEGSFLVDTFPSLRITELMYNPAEPSTAERLAGFYDNDDFEYIELQNTGAQTMNLLSVRLTDGIEFTFGDMLLGPDEYILVVKNLAAFDERYGIQAHGIKVAGEYSGALSNGGERIEMLSAVGDVVHDFEYHDDWYDHTDGEGFSLTILNPSGILVNWNTGEGWRGSSFVHGSPGSDDFGCAAGAIIISEVLAHSNVAPNDRIELHNTTDEAIDIGSWFLSDSREDLCKYQIADGTEIAAHGYVVFSEDANFGPFASDPGRLTGFALSELGDEVFLSSGVDGQLSGYREHVDFGASPAEMPYGLHVNSAGEGDFTLLSEPTWADDNAAPYVGDLVIHEVMYHPVDPTAAERAAGFTADEDFEYIELFNRSGAALNLTKFYLSGGTGFTFGWYGTDTFSTARWTLEKGATASWTANLPLSGEYGVWVYVDNADGNGGTYDLDSAARYDIPHVGGTTTVVLDQNYSPGQWAPLGSFTFSRGAASVVLTRGTADPDERTIADRVRFLGPQEVIVDDDDEGFEAHGSGVTVLPAGGYVVLVSNRQAFDERYDIDGNGIAVAGEYTGYLDNGGERLRLCQAGMPELTGYIPYLRIDHVRYNDLEPWPLEPDGGGSSLCRLVPADYGNDPANWGPSSRGGSPGRANLLRDTTPPLAPEHPAAQAVTASRIDVSWDAAVEPDSVVAYYVVYRDGEELTTTTETQYSDTGLVQTQPYSYEISAVNMDGFEGERSQAVVAAPRLGLVSAHAGDAGHVTVVFTSPLDAATCQDPANYTITGPAGEPIGVVVAGIQVDPSRVVLTVTTALKETVNYRLQVEDVRDATGSLIEDDSETVFAYRDVDPDLVAWWPLDEGTGGMATDATGNLRHLRIVGAAWDLGVRGWALRFDGVDDYAVDDDGEDYINGLAEFTIAMWIRADAIGTDDGFFTVGNVGSSDCISLRHDYFGWSGTKPNTYACFLSATLGNTNIEGAAETQTTDWQHVALTWSTGEAMKLYLDGQLQTPSYDKGAVDGTVNAATQVLLGMGERGSSYAWSGLIDDVRIYSRQLGPSDIAVLVNQAPVAVDDDYDVPAGGSHQVGVAGGVLANDADPDSGPLPMTASLISGVAHGQLTLQGDGAFEYTPAGGYTGSDCFTYLAFDGLSYSRAATVTLHVAGGAPTVTGFERNDGADRPSELTSLAIRFSQDVSDSLDISDLLIHNDSAGLAVDLAGATLTYDAPTNTARWDLAGVPILCGYHTIALPAEAVTNSTGQPLGGQGENGFQTTVLVAVAGDADLDGQVGRADFLALKAHFGQASDHWADGDFDYNGEIDCYDYLLLKAHAGTVLEPAPLAPLGAEVPAGEASLASASGEEVLAASRAAAEADQAAAPTAERPAADAQAGPDATFALLAAASAWYGDPLAEAAAVAPQPAETLKLPTPQPPQAAPLPSVALWPGETIDALGDASREIETQRPAPASGIEPLRPDVLDVLAASRLAAALTA